MVRLQESGCASSTLSRSSSGSWTEPPVESCTTSPVLSCSACTVSRSRVWSSVGRCSPSRMCTWIIPAPAASHSCAVATSSSSVVGSCGQSALVVSAPVGATVIRIWSDGFMGTDASCQRRHCRHTGRVRAVVQRVLRAKVTVDGEQVGGFDEPGLLVYLGVTHGDGPDEIAWTARKIWELRLLRDEQSASDVGAPIVVVSQFTLYGAPGKG